MLKGASWRRRPSRMADYVWQPITPHRAAELLAGLRARWWIAGGWAIDLFVGRTTRRHGDMDIALPRGSEPALRACLPAWDIQIPHDGQFIPWDGGPMKHPYHQLWARPDLGGPWAFDFMLEEHRDDAWIYRRDERVTLPLVRLDRTTEDGLHYICPEVALLYKARSKAIEHNAADFESAVSALSTGERRWLREALAIAHPGHAWIERLG
jgi:hypothetical protein